MVPSPRICCVKLKCVFVCSIFLRGVSNICMFATPLTRMMRLSVRM